MDHLLLSKNSQADFLHDLSSPLTVALGMVDGALRSFEGERSPAKDKLEKALSSLLKLSELIRSRRELLNSLPEDPHAF